MIDLEGEKKNARLTDIFIMATKVVRLVGRLAVFVRFVSLSHHTATMAAFCHICYLANVLCGRLCV